MGNAKLCWLDVRGAGALKRALVEEALHQRIDGIVAADLADLDGLPPTVTKVLFPSAGNEPASVGDDVMMVAPDTGGIQATAPFVEVTDQHSLTRACALAAALPLVVLAFRDPTKIPLEIVLAAAARRSGTVITMASDLAESRVLFGVLEHGSDGVMLRAREVGDATRLKAAAVGIVEPVELLELTITATNHVGMGERACVDTCSYLGTDEGLLVGSHSKGMVLCASETHPLPYMPTRPFRVNAGGLHSYVLGSAGRTYYLSELHAGSEVLAVNTEGRARRVTVGRVKIESRPLLSLDARSSSGQPVNLIVQDDWHVRLLGPVGQVCNSTELRTGDVVLGSVLRGDRHVGLPIDEFCLEQ